MKLLLPPQAFFLLFASASFSLGCADSSGVTPTPYDATVPTDNGVPDVPAQPDGDVPTGDAAPTFSRCDPVRSRLEPVGWDDVSYPRTATERIGCLDNPCVCDPVNPSARRLIEGVLRCENIAGGYYWGQGSGTILVRGRAERRCQIEIATETEGGAMRYQCSVPMPIVSWPGLMTSGDTTMGGPSLISGIESYCTRIEDCSLLPGHPMACSSDLLQCASLGTSRCGASP